MTVRLTGAGDCLVGGKLASICARLNFMQSVALELQQPELLSRQRCAYYI